MASVYEVFCKVFANFSEKLKTGSKTWLNFVVRSELKPECLFGHVLGLHGE